MRSLRRGRREGGSIMVLSGLVITLLVFVAAFAVDIAHQSTTKRDLHRIADLAAQDATFALGGNSTSQAACPPNALNQVQVDRCAQTLAVSSAIRNGFPAALAAGNPVADPTGNGLVSEVGDQSVTTIVGTWNANLSPQFSPIDTSGDPAGGGDSDGRAGNVQYQEYDADTPSDATAVQVTVTSVEHNLIETGSHQLSATAVARVGRAGVQAGTYAARADVNNAYLGSWMGLNTGNGTETVTAAGYDGLASASVTLKELQAAGGFATPGDLLNSHMTVGKLLSLAAQAYDPSGTSNDDAAVALRHLAADASSSTTTQATTLISPGQLMAVAGAGGSGTAEGTTPPCNPVNPTVPETTTPTLPSTTTSPNAPCVDTSGIADNSFVGNVGSGAVAEEQAQFNLLELVMAAPEAALVDGSNVIDFTMPSSVTLPVPNLASFGARVTLTAIEAPQIAYGPVGTTAQTAQVRAEVTLSGVVNVAPPIGPPMPVSFNIPIVLQGFGGTGVITSIDCGAIAGPASTPDEVDILATPSAAIAGVGVDTNLANPIPGTLPSTALISIGGAPVVSGSVGPIDISTSSSESFRFDQANPANNPTSTYNWSTAQPYYRGPLSTPSEKVGASLLDRLEGIGQQINDAETTVQSNQLVAPVEQGWSGFASSDVGVSVSGPGIPPGTVIASVQNDSTANLSNPATTTTFNDSITLGDGGASTLVYTSSAIPLSTLESSVIDQVFGNLDAVLTALDNAVGISAAGMDSWNVAWPGTPVDYATAPDPGIDCTRSMIVK